MYVICIKIVCIFVENKKNMNTITIILFGLVLIPSIILLWFIIISEIINFKKEKLREKLKEAALKSDEALLDYVYNHFEL